MWVEVFKTGKWIDSQGREREWTEDDLDRIVEKYDPEYHEAPVVIGHPKDDSPAYGWVEKLEKRGKSLWAKIKPTVKEFMDWVKSGIYKKVSISLYPDLVLRHIGFLGGMPPAIKGLKPAQFSDSEYTQYEFREWTTEERKKLEEGKIKGEFAGPNNTFPIASCSDVNDAWRLAGHADNPDEVRRNIIRIAKKYGWTRCLPDTAKKWAEEHNINFNELKDGGFEMGEIEKLRKQIEELRKKLDEKEKESSSFAEKIKEYEEKIKELEKEKKDIPAEFSEQIKAKEKEIKDLREKIAKIEEEARKKEYNEFIDGLVSAGKVMPKEKEKVLMFMENMDGVEYEFSEGDKTVKRPLIEDFKAFLKSLPKRIEFREFQTKEDGKDKSASPFVRIKNALRGGE